MTKQKQKYHLAMAGEYYVAAQLNRLNLNASVTYGNAKSADVIVFDSDSEKAMVIEVKTSSKGRWPIGSRVPNPSKKIWVFVNMPMDEKLNPDFYIMTQAQIHDELKPGEDAYFVRYKEKHGKEYGDKPGVASMSEKVAMKYINQWSTIRESLVA